MERWFLDYLWDVPVLLELSFSPNREYTYYERVGTNRKVDETAVLRFLETLKETRALSFEQVREVFYFMGSGI